MKRTILLLLLLLISVGCGGTKYLFPKAPILHCYQDPPPTKVMANKAGHNLIEKLRTISSENRKECLAYNKWAMERNKKYAKN